MRKVINIGDNIYNLVFDEFEDDIDIDYLLKIDYSNIIGELITFPVIVNRFGKLLADIDKKLSEAKLAVEICEAKVKDRERVNVFNITRKKPTVEELSNLVILDKGCQILQKNLIDVQNKRDIINSIAWSIRDKSEKLNKLSLSIQFGDLSDLQIEDKINNISIRKTKNLIS